MTSLRRWTDPIDPARAEREFQRFVRKVSKKRAGNVEPRDDETTTMVSAPTRPPRRGDEETTTFHRHVDDPDVDAIAKRRLLGLSEVDASMEEEERRKLLVELKALYRHGHVSDVLSELEKVRSKHPNDIELHGALAEFFLEQGDLRRATDMLFSLVAIYYERADAGAARRCLERIRGLDPTHRRLKTFERLLAG